MSDGIYTSNGYVMIGAPVSDILRTTNGISWSSKSNSEDVMTNTGDNGSTRGTRMATVTLKNAIPEDGDSTLRKMNEAYEAGIQLDVQFFAGPMVKSMRGTIKSADLQSDVNSAATLSFEISGKEGKTQGG